MSIIISIIALGLIVAFHEFGHFIIARLFKVGVIEFSIGMGPRVFSRVKNNTRYSLRALPFGGSCMMLGEEIAEEEDDGNEDSPDFSSFSNAAFEKNTRRIVNDYIEVDGRRFKKKEQFINKAAWQRFCILFAGPFFNFILAFLFAIIITTYYGYDRSEVLSFDENAPIATSGLEAGDTITGIGIVGNSSRVHFSSVETSRDLQLYMLLNDASLQNHSTFAIRYRDADTGRESEAYVEPFYDEETGLYRLGLSYNGAYAPADNIGEILYYSLYDVRYCIKSVVLSLRLLFSGGVSRSDVMGPVRIVALMDESVSSASSISLIAALMTLFNLIVLLSGTIGATNLLPIPALDGGRLVFVLIEMVTRHAVPKELEARVHMAGMLVLLALMVFIMFNDVSTLIFG